MVADKCPTSYTTFLKRGPDGATRNRYTKRSLVAKSRMEAMKPGPVAMIKVPA